MKIKYKLWRTNEKCFAIVSNAPKNIGDLFIDKFSKISKIKSISDIEKHKKDIKVEARAVLFVEKQIDFNGFEDIVGYFDIDYFIRTHVLFHAKGFKEQKKQNITKICKSVLQYYIFHHGKRPKKERFDKKWDIDVEFTDKSIIKIIKVY